MKKMVVPRITQISTQSIGKLNSSIGKCTVGAQSHQLPTFSAKMGNRLLEKGNNNFKAHTFPCVKESSNTCEKSPNPKLSNKFPREDISVRLSQIPIPIMERETSGA